MWRRSGSRSAHRAVLAVVVSFSLVPSTASAQQLPPGVPPYPTAQSGAQRQTAQNPIAAAGRASLNFPPDRGDPVALQCDQLADPPHDPQRLGSGVPFEKIQTGQALPVCEEAASARLSRPRYQYLYGRVLLAAEHDAEAARYFTAADQAGYALGSFALAQLYEDGFGVSRNWNEAVRLYFRAGNAGLADAFAEGGMLFVLERPPDYGEAASWFEKAVEGGSADGLAYLGELYQDGHGVQADLARAVSLYNESAKRGSSEGVFRVGLLHRYGAQQDPRSACAWFHQAAQSGHTYAQHELGKCYYSGDDGNKDHQSAFRWFLAAAQGGWVNSQVAVAYMYESGDGVTQNDGLASAWYRKAAEQNDAYAMTQLGAHLRLGKGVAWGEAEAMQWFAKAAKMGYVPAETSLAMGYRDGLGQDAGQGRQDYEQAAYWFGQAAKQGDGFAQINLGVMNEKGWGIPQDLQRAKELYAQAAANSNPEVAKLGREYFSDVPASAPPNMTARRTSVSSSRDSSDLWQTVILAGLAIGAVALLSSSGSSDSTSSGAATGHANVGANYDPWKDPLSNERRAERGCLFTTSLTGRCAPY